MLCLLLGKALTEGTSRYVCLDIRGRRELQSKELTSSTMLQLRDRFGRSVNSLRIAVTQKCNLNCFYCHKEGEPSSSREMDGEEICKIVEVACNLGVTKIKLTGGEPLLRKDICQIIKGISSFTDKVSLTTNGVLLEDFAEKLCENGLKRVNVSLPSLKESCYERITGKNFLLKVKEGVEAAVESGLNPVKLNFVVLKGLNDEEIPAMIDFAHHTKAILQLIEFQSILRGNESFWKKRHYELAPMESWLKERAIKLEFNELHKRRKYFLRKNANTVCVEVVRPIHNTVFCQNCTRLRVTSDGKLKPCLMRNDNLVEAVSLIRQSGGLDNLKEAFWKAVELREPWWRQKK